ncbi:MULTISPECIES: TIM barrel protein [unclassified Lysobacter]|uniref:hydroxypyruvate isomerase family protein n=1 Tax=unclassified Lysobacter TaxID=2635362 RepID=UPI001BE95666|nr:MULTISPECIES: TIM barrel protein [unclassified Lysobacter]MBT2744924.1 TIM barrel protein [Lysobacter sp. ISL-42]MBT2752083.1 TIM barrel protein [Lysobacter sp. ISL-50]MBT2778580.1 TIM barrel protein [Lysobacter sp. ISL-54]MBT2780489.1 TIM barrel protein [Lysobacter sp. ISL-52]
MQRRAFLQSTAAAAAATVLPSMAAVAAKPAAHAPAPDFKLKYAPHLGMFEASAGKDPIAQIRYMAQAGFKAFEDNELMQRPVALQERIGETLAGNGMTMGVFVIDAGDNWKVSYTTGKKEFREAFVKTCREAVATAKRVNAKWMTIVPGFFEAKLPVDIQTGHVIDAIRAGAEVIEPHGLIMVMEPLSDRPELFLRTSAQAYAIARAVDSPACKILYDIYHLQRNEGNLIHHIDLAWDEIAYFQIGDVPGRKEPGTGEINYRNIFAYIHERMHKEGRDFVFGMEHGNASPGVEGEQRLIAAYRRSDDF